jgi:predicted Zn-dependent peptidase
MKLLSQFENKYNNITYKLYQLENGIKFLHLVNPATIDTDFAIIVKAGSAFEKKENVPQGTAHFLEHMILNPNSTFKSREEIDRFEQGNSQKAGLDMNAYTSRKNIYFVGHTNEKGTDRLLERVDSLIQFPKDIFKNHMKKECEVVIAEKSRKQKKEKDAYLLSLEFLFNDHLPEFTGDVLGEIEDIKKIRIEDLEKYFKDRFKTGNTVFALQTEKDITPSMVQKLEKMSQYFYKGDTDNFRKISLKNEYRIGTFTDERANGFFFSLIYFKKEPAKYDYKDLALSKLSNNLISWLAFNKLREEMGLIYDFSGFNTFSNSYEYSLSGFKFTTENQKIAKMLKELDNLMYVESFKFLKTEQGKEWFDDAMSNYIYPRTTKFDPEIAENTVVSLLEGNEIYNHNLFVDEMKKLTILDIEKHLKKFLKIPPHIWMESDMSDIKMKKIVEKSPLGKKYNKVV